jgi:hypothetical protein
VGTAKHREAIGAKPRAFPHGIDASKHRHGGR